MTLFTAFTSARTSAKVILAPRESLIDRKMLQTKELEAPSAQRRKILLVGRRPSVESLISTFLVTMGCTCIAASEEEAPATLEREVFDAVLLDLGDSDARGDEFILQIKHTRPSLADRIIVVTSAGQRVPERIGHHHLHQISREGLLPQLWATLQELFISRRSWQLPLRKMRIPRIVFDSFRSPTLAGVRGLSPAARQLAYQHKTTVIDLSIESPEGSGRTSIAGQVLDTEKKGINDGLSVLLVCGLATLVRTATNQFGEFHLEFECAEAVSLEIRLDEGSWLLVPLGRINWAGKRPSDRPAES